MCVFGREGASLALSQALGLLGHALLPSCRKTPCSQKGGVCVVCMWKGVLSSMCVHIAVSVTLHKTVMGLRLLFKHR